MTIKDCIIFPKPRTHTQACVKFYNEHGRVLSFAADDSAGAFPDLRRSYLACFESDAGPMIGNEIHWATPEEFLRALAEHLGYQVTKKSAEPQPAGA